MAKTRMTSSKRQNPKNKQQEKNETKKYQKMSKNLLKNKDDIIQK